ncbi:hypothetical protein BC833DRAFT_564630 [Globomyces pollinis-pini]|nr:hypothetical protein BC833DRAFT_564630 [Globomyces pollinis-pini]
MAVDVHILGALYRYKWACFYATWGCKNMCFLPRINSIKNDNQRDGVALVQLAVKDQVFLFYLSAMIKSNPQNSMKTLPPIMNNFLEDKRFVRVGLKVSQDLQKLHRYYHNINSAWD